MKSTKLLTGDFIDAKLITTLKCAELAQKEAGNIINNVPSEEYRQKTFESYARKGDDPVVHPKGYTQGKIECWDFISDQGLDFLSGNVVKYVVRHKHKNGLEDLKKARQYLDKLMEVEYGENE